jgi:hypothetical protein
MVKTVVFDPFTTLAADYGRFGDYFENLRERKSKLFFQLLARDVISDK